MTLFNRLRLVSGLTSTVVEEEPEGITAVPLNVW